MTDHLQVGLDPKPLVDGLAVATSALAEFKAAIASLNNTPTAQLKSEMASLTGAMQNLSKSLEGVFANVGEQVESSMKSAQAAAKAGALELASIEEKRIEKSQDVNRRATNWFIAEQAKMLGASKETLSAIKNQSKAMWADKKAEETAEVKAYVSQVDVLNAQIKAAHQRQAEALNRQTLAVSRGARAQVNQAMLTAGTYSVSEGAGVGTVKVAKGMEDLTPAVSKAEMTIAGWGRTVKKAEEAGTSLRSANRVLSSSMHELHSASRGLASGFGAMWLTWGSIIPLLAGAAVSNAAAQALKAGADVGQSLATIQHLGGASTQEMQQLNTALLETSRVGPFGPREVAKALETMSLAGLSAKEQLQALKPVLDFSVAGNLPIEKAAESLLAISAAFGYQAQDLRVTSDVVAKTAAVSMTTVESMTASFRVASVVAQQYGISIQDVSVSLALLAKVGITGQAAGTAVRQMYSELIGSSKKAKEVMEKTLNFDAFTNNNKALKPLIQMFTELGTALSKLDFKSQNRVLLDMSNERATKAIAANLSALRSEFAQTEEGAQQFASEIVTMAQKIADAPGFTAIAAIGMSGSTLNQMKSVASSFQTAMVEAFQAVEPAVLRVTSALQELFKSEGFRTGVKDLVSGVADFTGKLVEHMGTIIGVGKAYIVYQASLLAYGVGAAAGTAITNAMASSFGRAAITAGVMNLAILGIPGAAGAASTALLALNAAAGWVGVAALAITGAYAAYKLFFEESASGSAQMVSDSRTRTEQVTKGLDEEISRLNIVIAAKGDQKDIQERTANVTRQGALELVLARGIEETATLKAARAEAVLSKQRWESYSMLPGVQDVVDYKQRGISELDRQIADVASKTQLEVESLAAKFAQVKKLAGEAAAIAEERKNKPNVQGTGVYTPGGAAKEKLSAHEKISKAIQEELTLAKAQLDSNDKLSASEKYRIKTLSEINDQYLRGKTTVKEWAQEAKDAWEAADYKKQFEDAQAYAKMVEASTAAHLSAVNAQDKRNESLKDQIEKQRESNDAIGLSADAVGELEKRTLLLSAAELIRKANLEDGVMRNQDTIDGLREQARLMQELANQKQIGGVKKAANEAHKEWQKTADKINDSITDALMRGFENGKGFAENLRDTLINMFKTMVLRPVIAAIVSPVGQAFAGVGGQTGSGGSAIGVAQSLKGVYDTITGGFTALGAGVTSAVNTLAVSSAGEALGMSTAVEAMGPAIEGGLAPTVQVMTSSTAAAASAMGAAASIAAGVVAGYGIGTAVSGQFGSNNTVKAGTVIGAVAGSILGPVGTAIGAAIGGTIGGVINRAFGMGDAHSREHGIEGQFRSGAFSGNSFDVQHQDGGWFRGDRDWTDRAPVDDITTKRFSEGFAALQKASASAAQALGFSATAIEDYSQDVRVSLTTDAEENKKIITKLFTDMGDSMANAVAPGLATFAKDGESAATTLSRLSGTLTTVNAWLGMMNHALFSLSMVSGDAATKLADAFGGLDNFTNASKAFYDSFYSDQEKISESTEAMSKALALVGVALPSSKDAFKEVARAMDLSTDAGRQAYAVLLSVAPEFSATADLIDKVFGGAAKTIRDNLEKEVGIVTTWANKLAVLQGTTTERKLSLEADLTTTRNDATKALIEHVYSLEDLKEATDKLTAANKEWQDQLDILTGAQTAHSIALRDAADESTRALMRQVYAMEDLKDATEKLKAANSSLKSSYASVSSAYKAIQDAATNAANAVVTAQDNITNGYLSAQSAVASAQENVANIAAQAAKELAGFAGTINDFLKEMATTDLGANSKSYQLAALKADFAITSAQARAGDTGALGALTGKAGALLKAGKEQSATALDFARLSSSVGNTLASISSTIAPAASAADVNPAVKAQADLTKAQEELAKWTNAVAVSGASTAKATTDYLDEWRKASAANALAQSDLLEAQEATKGIQMTVASRISGLLDAIESLNENLTTQASAVVAMLAAMTVKGTGGTDAGAGSYTGTQVSDGIKAMTESGASTAQIVSKASTGFGVTSADLAKVADVMGNTAITDYQKAANNVTALDQSARDNVVAQANAIAAAQGISPERALYNYATTPGIDINAAMVDKYMGWANGTSNGWAAANNLPAFDVGTNYVPRDMDARIHEGEMIVPKAFNPVAGGFQNGDLDAKVEVLNALITKLLASSQRSEESSRSMAKILKLVTRDGEGMMINEDTSIPVTVYM